VNGKVERCSCDFGQEMPPELLARMIAGNSGNQCKRGSDNGRGQPIRESAQPASTPNANRRVIESVACPKCGGSVTVWSDGAVEDCQCRGKKRDKQELTPAAKTQPVSALQAAQRAHEVTDRPRNESR